MTEPDRPLWLLDIDGVVNALGPSGAGWPGECWIQRVVRTQVPGRGLVTLPILAARPVLEFISAVHEFGTAEIRWHSTWRVAAVTGLAPALGLPPIPISIAPEWSEPGPAWWKVPAATRALAAGRRLLWTDDDLSARRTADDIAQLAGREDALLLSPDPLTGLSPDDLGAIAAFLGVGPDGRPTGS